MKLLELECLLKQHISRGIILEGMGLVALFVPKKSVKRVEELMEIYLPAGIGIEINPLNQPMQEGLFEVGRLRDKTIISLCRKYRLYED